LGEERILVEMQQGGAQPVIVPEILIAVVPPADDARGEVPEGQATEQRDEGEGADKCPAGGLGEDDAEEPEPGGSAPVCHSRSLFRRRCALILHDAHTPITPPHRHPDRHRCSIGRHACHVRSGDHRHPLRRDGVNQFPHSSVITNAMRMIDLEMFVRSHLAEESV
jgi:hypothetical protein